MPAPPISRDQVQQGPGEEASPDPTSPYQRIAADLRGAIACGALQPGDPLPSVEQLRARYQVAAGTANRAVAELKELGLVTASRGRRATVSG